MTSLSMEEQKSLRFQQKYLYLCCKDEWRSCGFGTTSGWVITDRIKILGWTIPLSIEVGKTDSRMICSWIKHYHTKLSSEDHFKKKSVILAQSSFTFMWQGFSSKMDFQPLMFASWGNLTPNGCTVALCRHRSWWAEITDSMWMTRGRTVKSQIPSESLHIDHKKLWAAVSTAVESVWACQTLDFTRWQLRVEMWNI